MELKMVTISELKESFVSFAASADAFALSSSQITYAIICLQHQIDVKTKIAWDLLGRVNIK
jgi:hypothetical protein